MQSELSGAEFDIQSVSKASFGAGVARKLGKKLKALGRSSAFVVTDRGLVAGGVVATIQRALEAEKVGCRVFDGVTPNPHDGVVAEGAARLREEPAAAVVPLGGGSSMDAAKAIALVAANGGTIRDFYPGSKPSSPGNPLLAVPTTAGTGSETNMYGVITDRESGRKLLVAHPSVQPVTTLLDPELGTGVPRQPTATCGMDVLTHAIEAFTCKRANPFSDALALQAIAMVARHLPRACDDGSDLEARAQMLLAAHLAGIAFTSSGLGICHAMGHPLSARLGAAHGQTLASLLPLVMRFNAEPCRRRYAEVARALGVADPAGSEEQNATRAIDAVTALRARVGADVPLRQLGAGPELLPLLIEDAFADVLMIATPRFPKPEEVRELYEAAM
jgi:alcohol dehydrogenase